MVQQCEKHMYTQHGICLSWCFCACKYIYPFYIAFRGRLGLNKGSTAASPRHNTTRRRLQTTHKCGPQCEGNLSRWRRVRKNLFLCCCRHRRHPHHHHHHHHHNTYHHSPQCSSIIASQTSSNSRVVWNIGWFLCLITSACRKAPWIRTRRRFRSRWNSVSCGRAVAWGTGLLSHNMFVWRWFKWMLQNHPQKPKE